MPSNLLARSKGDLQAAHFRDSRRDGKHDGAN